MVAANRVANSRPGTIGLALASVRTCIVDIDSGSPLSPGEVGMLLVAGESVFSGYYRYQGQSPFVELAGQRWYRTGDLVSQDADGFLTFHGRLKRFLKAGGEMISLPALEEPFVNRFPADENGPKMAVEGVETDDGRHIVLFTTEDITLRQASQWLIEAGLRGVMRVDEVRRVGTYSGVGYRQNRLQGAAQTDPARLKLVSWRGGLIARARRGSEGLE